MAFFIPLIIVIVTSLLGLSGGLLLLYKEKIAKLISKYLINFSIGVLFGVVFLDILPEIIKENQNPNIFFFTLLGIIVFYVLEKSLIWYHHHSIEDVWRESHTVQEQMHSVGYLLTLGDALHNFIDGLIIAASFLVDFRLGIVSSLTILLHELPQEIGEFAIMLHKGIKKSKIITYNIVAQSFAIVGFLIGYFYLGLFNNLKFGVLAFAAGGFIYIASTDLLPETHREKSFIRSLIQVLLLFLGIFIIWYFGFILPE